MMPTVPPHIRSIVERLHASGDELSRDAAALISGLVEQSAPENIVVDLTNNTVSRAGLTLSVSPNRAVVMHLLAEKYPAVVSVVQIHRALYGPATGRSVNTVRVMMCDLRKRLAPLKLAIRNRNGVGYKLELLPVR